MITAVNGIWYDKDSQEELFDALRDPGWPNAVTFCLTNSEEAEHIHEFCASLSIVGLEGANNGRQEPVDSNQEKFLAETIGTVILTEDGQEFSFQFP